MTCFFVLLECCPLRKKLMTFADFMNWSKLPFFLLSCRPEITVFRLDGIAASLTHVCNFCLKNYCEKILQGADCQGCDNMTACSSPSQEENTSDTQNPTGQTFTQRAVRIHSSTSSTIWSVSILLSTITPLFINNRWTVFAATVLSALNVKIKNVFRYFRFCFAFLAVQKLERR